MARDLFKNQAKEVVRRPAATPKVETTVEAVSGDEPKESETATPERVLVFDAHIMHGNAEGKTFEFFPGERVHDLSKEEIEAFKKEGLIKEVEK